ncbi:hypothetical protein B0H14DRAFT_3427721 [Mycena olivaceomarginata]|nr:hypothetical protein B0H14DRAFT_3427721 [Mycena olivaceomarginata]
MRRRAVRSTLRDLIVSNDAETDNGTGSEFVPEERTTSPDSDEEFPSSLTIPSGPSEMEVDEESTPPRTAHMVRITS